MKHHRRDKSVWMDKLIHQWENLVLLYLEARKKPTIRILMSILMILVKILLRILLRKAIEFFRAVI